MGILIALVPAILWGCNPLWAHVCGGKSIQQLLGATYGAIILGALIYFLKCPVITTADFWWCFFAGAGWSIGQLTQFSGFIHLGAATTTPISAGTQLVAVNLIGVLFLGSWQSPLAKIIGAIAVIMVIIGVFLTTKTGKQSKSHQEKANKYLIELILGSVVGYGACSTFPKVPQASGWVTFPPQAVGMITSAIVIALIIPKYRCLIFSKPTFKNMATGFNTSLGTIGYLVSLMINGVSTAFTLSQMSIVVGTLVGLVLLHEHKTKLELIYIIIGMLLVVIGGAMTSFIK